MFRLVLGTTKSQLLDERSDDREGGRQQAGNVIGSLYGILSVIGNQCNSRKAGVTWSPSFKSRILRLLHARFSVDGLVSSPANLQEQRCSGQGATAPNM